MSTREQIEAKSQGNSPTSTGQVSNDSYLEITPCTIEDVDRGIFDLFDKTMPLFYKTKKEGTRRVPVVFAAGERFALIARKKPLRDKSNALIIPIVSIMRTGVTASPELGAGTNQMVPHVIRKRLAVKDPLYQRLLNKVNLKNSDNLASIGALINQNTKTSAEPGRVATRRDGTHESNAIRKGQLLANQFDAAHIYEITEIPPVKYYTATYEIVFWTQYVQQMNDMLMALMSLPENYSGRSFSLKTKTGYSFVAYLDSALSSDNNFSEYSSEERIIKYSMTMKVQGYIVGSTYPGAPNRLRRYYSMPEIKFESLFVNGQPFEEKRVGVASANPSDYVGADFRRIDAPLPGQSIGGDGLTEGDRSDSALVGQASNETFSKSTAASVPPGDSGEPVRNYIIVEEKDIMTGDSNSVKRYIKTRSNRQGESVIREIF